MLLPFFFFFSYSPYILSCKVTVCVFLSWLVINKVELARRGTLFFLFFRSIVIGNIFSYPPVLQETSCRDVSTSSPWQLCEVGHLTESFIACPGSCVKERVSGSRGSGVVYRCQVLGIPGMWSCAALIKFALFP